MNTSNILNFYRAKTETDATGQIWALEGNLYVAFQLGPQGQFLKKAPLPFRSVSDARDWLNESGVNSIAMQQANAYFEMVGCEESRELKYSHAPLK